MQGSPTRIISVTAVPINIRKTAAYPGDVNAYPVTYATLRYASGGETIELLGGSPFARGVLTILSNNLATETIAVNGVTFTFITGPSTATDVQVGDTIDETASNFAAVLNASANGSINVATYVAGPNGTVSIVYDTAGTGGNAFTLANSNNSRITRSAATLTGGQGYGNGTAIDADADYNDPDQSLERYVVASGAGPTNLRVTDWRA